MTVENTLQIFTNTELNANIRVVEIDGQPFFVAKDVCDALELTNPTMAIDRLDDDERAKFNLGRQGETNVVNEFGLYNLILGSRKPEAKQFKRWITHEVLPSIRKTGSYQNPQFNRKAGDTFFVGGVHGYFDENGKAFFSLKDTAKAIGMTMNIPGKKNNPYIRWCVVNNACKKLNIIDDNQIVDKDSFIPEDDFRSLVMSTRRKPAAELQNVIAEGLKPATTNIMIKQPKDVLYQLVKDIRCAGKEIEETFNVSHFTAIDRAIALKEKITGIELEMLRELIPSENSDPLF